MTDPPIETSPPPPRDHRNLKPSCGFEIKPHGSAFFRVCSGASPISQRLPPLPSSTSHQIHAPSGFPKTVAVGTVDRKDAQSNTINFASSQPVTATSYMSSLTGDTDSITPSMSSGFQITNPSNVSSAGKPPSYKRKCTSVDDSKCGTSSGRCHCSKRNYDDLVTNGKEQVHLNISEGQFTGKFSLDKILETRRGT